MGPWTPPPPKLCALCNLKVYPVEELYVDSAVYHKACFRCSTCLKMLSLGEYASHRLEPGTGGVALFCKPHFKQAFLEHGRYAEMGNGLSPLAAVSPGLSANFKPSGVTLFREPGEGDGGEGSPAAPPPPPARATSKTPADFESGFEPEFKPAGAKPLGAAACAKCAKKVFAVCQLKADGGKLYHADCFRCATCGQQLAPASFAVAEEGATYCMKHAPKDARFPGPEPEPAAAE